MELLLGSLERPKLCIVPCSALFSELPAYLARVYVEKRRLVAKKLLTSQLLQNRADINHSIDDLSEAPC